jgi:hypothetical protein
MDYPHFLQLEGHKKFHFSGRFGILINEKFSGVAEQGHAMLYGKSQLKGESDA